MAVCLRPSCKRSPTPTRSITLALGQTGRRVCDRLAGGVSRWRRCPLSSRPRTHVVRGRFVCRTSVSRRAAEGIATLRNAHATTAQHSRQHSGGPISVEPRINDRIRVPEVRLVGPNGEQVGIVAIGDALRLAQEADLDLVEVAAEARPPVCKLMDYGKWKYENAQKAREARRNQSHTVIKEMKLRPKIDPHDYETKKGHVVRFLKAGDKVKITIMFRGREQSRPELGFRLLQRLAADVEDLGVVEAAPKQDGRNMIMVMAPHRGAQPQAARARRAEPGAAQAPSPT
jgi:translation initiation factor IF-3